ncbi:hypothetical protein MAHJHV60_17770 [Mycobacterium avium subsp. hominissuis]
MGCSSREEIVEVFDALDAAVDRLGELSFDALTPRNVIDQLMLGDGQAPAHRLATLQQR